MKNYCTHLTRSIFFSLFTLILFSLTSKGQIIYTNLIPDSVFGLNGAIYPLDLNNDGTVDFNIKQTKSTATSTFCTGTKTRHGVTVSPVDTLQNAVANSSYTGVNFPYPISADSIINDSSFIWVKNSNQNLVNINWACTGTKSHRTWRSTITGKWNGATDKFLGLKFKVGSNTYYGWVRLTISTVSFTVKDYAYNNVPDQLIFAGQSTTEFLTASQISGSPFCAGDSLNVGFTVYGNFDSTNVFTAQLSDSAGNFVNPVSIGSHTGNVSGTINATIPPSTVYSLLYRIRVVASSPVGVSNFNNTNLIVNTTLPINHVTSVDSAGICVGDSARLLATAQSGNSYQWSLDSTNINNATLYYFYGKSEGSYRCMITNGCGSILSDSILVNFLLSPQAKITRSGGLWICPGQSVNLSTDSISGLTFTWYRNNSTVGNLSQYTATLAGSYRVRVTNSLGCYSYSVYDTVLISKPVAHIIASGPTSFCSGDSVLLSLTSYVDSSFTFQWYRSSNVIPGAWNSTYYAKQTGSYNLIVTNPNGNCDSISNVIDVIAICDGIEMAVEIKTHFTLGPNPSNHFLEIRKQSEKPATFQIINHLGQIVSFEKINSSQKLIDVSNFSEGVYSIKWIEEDYSESKQFTVVN